MLPIFSAFFAVPAMGSSANLLTKIPIFSRPADPNSDAVSADALQVMEILGLTEKFKYLQELKDKLPESAEQKPSMELRQDLRDCKLEIIEVIEQARLDIDFVFAEIEAEQAVLEELLEAYGNERDHRINNANLQAFRVNGALWAVAEAFDIPTYKMPRYSIPSGTIGILAGIVPSAFSVYALRSMPGGHYKRDSYPNILSKVFDYPTQPRIEFPTSVWKYVNSVPAITGPPTIDSDKRIRLQLLKDHWLQDPNIATFKHEHGEKQLDQLTGKDQNCVNMDLLGDRLTMLREVKALVYGMNRPLRELAMVESGKKHF
jgi:hypothetical protein